MRPVVIIVAVVLVLIAGPIAFLKWHDRCAQHSTELSISISTAVKRQLREKGYFAVQDLSVAKPVFYCLVGPKAMSLDIREFAKRSNFRLPAFQFFCGFWTADARLLLIYDVEVVDVAIPGYLSVLPDDSAAACFTDPGIPQR